jgi:VIT1/CCC1 family predicted Fe2+/Mn2+ transporter
MPTSTPEQRQKLCSYCSTPADPLDTSCANCGSALPVAMPLAVARLMEAQGKLQLRQAGFIVIGVSAAIGALLAVFSGLFALLMIVWIIFIAPAMLMITAWSNAYRKNGSMLGNSAIAVGVWILSIIVMSIMGAIVGSIVN